jgi:hypothetical protein
VHKAGLRTAKRSRTDSFDHFSGQNDQSHSTVVAKPENRKGERRGSSRSLPERVSREAWID